MFSLHSFEIQGKNHYFFGRSTTLKVPHRPYTSPISYRVPKLIVFLGGGSGGGGGRLFEEGRLLQILSLRRGVNSKRVAYLKLGANSSIYGGHFLFMCVPYIE